MEWRNLGKLPEATGEGWQAKRVNGRVLVDKSAVDEAVAKWHLLDPLLIGRPGSRRFLPVLAVEEYRDLAHRSVMRRQRFAILVFVVLGTGLAAAGWMAGRPQAVRTAIMALALAAFAAVDYRLVVRRLDALADRALLTLWVCRAGRVYALGWAAAMLAAGALQIYGETVLGGHEPLVLEFGAVREYVFGAEAWRLLIGPFLHASLAHWLANLAMMAVVGAVAGSLLGAASVPLFVCGSSFGALIASLLAAYTHVDAYLGVSAGVFAWLGWCAAAALKAPERFPRGFAVTALGFAFLNAAIAAAANPEASNIGHLAGLVLGLVWGLAAPSPGAKTGRPSPC